MRAVGGCDDAEKAEQAGREGSNTIHVAGFVRQDDLSCRADFENPRPSTRKVCVPSTLG